VRDPDASTVVPQQPGKGAEPPRRRSRRARSRGASGWGVIQHPAFAVEPWAVRETALDLGRLAQTESVFALGKIIRLTVENEPFDVRRGELRKHERVLDLRAGVLRRTAEWVSPTGRLVRVSSARLVSFTHRSIAAILYEVEPLEDAVQVVVPSELVTNETLPVTEQDPRAAAALASPLATDFFIGEELRAMLMHTTKASRLTVAAAMDHRVDGPPNTRTTIRSSPDLARVTITRRPRPAPRARLARVTTITRRSRPSTSV
jgi:alpha,alpha-trehalose phosphorylase